jgi:maltose alpha-D-glucosyltransferase / alpha-amylase
MREQDPYWYKDAILYELHVRAFYDSDGDGIGDFRGLTEKLDYLQDLGVTDLWLLPFYPSPLKDDGYDIADYTGVHPNYGTLTDFKHFVQAAHRRGLRVVTELVLNHTSDQHPWFQRARRSPPGSPERDFYVWSDTPERYKGARVIFQDFEPSNWAWDPLAKAYYWHRFYAHQPDLNYDNPAVWEAILPVVDCWLSTGVDGLRLDAVPYLYECEGTSSENLPKTHQFLQTLRRHVDTQFPQRMLLAEANQWPEDACAYFGRGDECHMAFHFPLMPRLFMAIHMEDRLPIVDIMAQTPPIPESCQWALFLRNHDELTLEMVTDEERCYLCWVYAHDPQAQINLGIRRRLAPLMGNNRRRIELMNGLLFSLPGTPVIYYGDELGMGDNIYLGDRNGVRTPMQWSPDLNAGFSRANPQQLYLPPIIDPAYHYQAINVAAQQDNQESLLWWMKRLIALRKRYRAFGRGSLEFLKPENPRILAFVRRYRDEVLLIVANLSRFVQHTTLDLAAFQNRIPVELCGRAEFPVVGREPLFLTLAPHAFYWFALELQAADSLCSRAVVPEDLVPVLTATDDWEQLFLPSNRVALETLLPAYLRTCPWFGGRARSVEAVRIWEAVRLTQSAPAVYFTLLRVEYLRGDPEIYALPFACATGEHMDRLLEGTPQAAVARLQGDNGCALLYDALYDPDCCTALLQIVAGGNGLDKDDGVRAWTTEVFERLWGSADGFLPPALLQTEQTNTLIAYGDRLILKFFRRLAEGVNPELEIGRFLTEHSHFVHTPPVVGALEYWRRGRQGKSITLAVLQGYVSHREDAWQYTLAALDTYFEKALALPAHEGEVPLSAPALLHLSRTNLPRWARKLLGPYLGFARLLGRRTAELHQALASAPEGSYFAPEPCPPLYRRSLYQSMRGLTVRVCQRLGDDLQRLPAPVRAEAEALLDRQDEILRRFRVVLGLPITGVRMRCHGDYHLRQVLHTGKGIALIDFEGEPARLLGERQLKRCPLLDVAGMLRSFHYAAYAAFFDRTTLQKRVPCAATPLLESWTRFWCRWVSAVFLRSYLQQTAQTGLLPETHEELQILCDIHLLEKAIYELGYELEHRPDWVRIPLRGILQLLEAH